MFKKNSVNVETDLNFRIVYTENNAANVWLVLYDFGKSLYCYSLCTFDTSIQERTNEDNGAKLAPKEFLEDLVECVNLHDMVETRIRYGIENYY